MVSRRNQDTTQFIGEYDMRLWQQSMIYLARSASMTSFMQDRASLSVLANRFVGGRSVFEASEKIEILRAQGAAVSLFFLGEYVEDPAVIDQAVSELKAMAAILAGNGTDIHMSVDPTQIGYTIAQDLLCSNARDLARTVKALRQTPSPRDILMLDMEDSSSTDATLALYSDLKGDALPVAITLQAYLFRTEEDLTTIMQQGSTVRLVKGAFAEKREIAFTRQDDIDRNYLDLSEIMLSEKAREGGFYPVFATHDDRMIEAIIKIAGTNGWSPSQYEFELLYGVRRALQQSLIRRGEQVRLYVPFGKEWWPYAIRRVGETPRNARFLLRSILAA